MPRIAHLSDVHMLDPKLTGSRYRFATRAVSLGRSIDPAGHAKKLSRALHAAKAAGADHVVISGDLTELGDPLEYEHLAAELSAARIDPSVGAFLHRVIRLEYLGRRIPAPVLRLRAWRPELAGPFRYAPAFDRL